MKSNPRGCYQNGCHAAFSFRVRQRDRAMNDTAAFVWRVWQVDWRVFLVTEFSFDSFWRHDSDQNPSVYAYV